jgi:hypothetical protein
MDIPQIITGTSFTVVFLRLLFCRITMGFDKGPAGRRPEHGRD